MSDETNTPLKAAKTKKGSPFAPTDPQNREYWHPSVCLSSPRDVYEITIHILSSSSRATTEQEAVKKILNLD